MYACQQPSIVVLAAMLLCACSPLKPTYVLGDGKTKALMADFSKNGQYIAAADATGVVRVWETNSGKEIANTNGFAAARRANSPAKRLIFSPDGSQIAFATIDGVRIWQWAGGANDVVLQGHPHPPRWIAFMHDGRVVAISGGYEYDRYFSARDAGSQPTREPLCVISWDIKTGRTMSRWEDNASGIFDASLSSDGERVATSGVPGIPRLMSDLPKHTNLRPEVTVRDTLTGNVVSRIAMQTIAYCTSLSPDGHLLVVNSLNNTSGVYDSASGNALQVLPIGWGIFTVDGKRISAIHDVTKATNMSPFYFIGLPIPPPAKPTIQFTEVDVQSGQSVFSKKRATTERTSPISWTPDLSQFIDSKLRLWKLKPVPEE